MSSFREILTFQFGNYSNYVGAHWWNIQESGFSYDPNAEPSDINHDVLYREGVNSKGIVTYTPRLLSIDLKGSLRHLPKDGELYTQPDNINPEDQSTGQLLWDSNNVDVIKSESIEKPAFQRDLDDPNVENPSNECDYNLSETTKSWTDYLVGRYHPRTINLIQSFDHADYEESFDCCTSGRTVWDSENLEDEFCDRIRQYVEECNNCQGFQMLFDCTNGFSGLALKCLEHLSDEYGKVNFVVPLFSPKQHKFKSADQPMSDSIRMVNIAMTYGSLLDYADLILPLSTMERCWRTVGNSRTFPSFSYANDNFYETSAVLATYLDTISLRYRLKDPALSSYLSGFCSDLNNYGRKLVAAGLALPFPMTMDQDLIECLDKFDGPIFTQLSPHSNIGTNRIIQSVCIRGIPKNRLKRPLKSAKEQMRMAAYNCDSVSEMLQLYFQCSNYASLAHVSAIPDPMPIKMPFPSKMFNENIMFDGFTSEFVGAGSQSVQSAPILATAQVSNDLSNTLETLHREASRIKIAKIHRFKDTGLDPDEYKDILEKLLDFKDIYDDISEL